MADEVLTVQARLVDNLSPALKGMTSNLASFGVRSSMAMQSFSGNIDRAAGKIINMRNALLAFGGVQVFKASFGSVEKYADDILTMSDRIAISTEFISKFRHAANITDASVGILEGVMRKFNKTLVDSERGLSTAVFPMEKVGVKFEDMKKAGLNSEQMFLKVFKATAQLPDATEKAAIGAELFGRAAQQLMPLMNMGAEGIEKLFNEAERLGVVLGRDTAAGIAAFDDRVKQLNASILGLKIKVLGPMVVKMTEAMGKFVDNFDLQKVTDQLKQAVEIGKTFFVLYAGGKMLAFAVGLEKAMLAARGFQGVMAALSLNPIMVAITGVAIAAAYLAEKMEQTADKMNNYDKLTGDQLQSLSDLKKSYEENTAALGGLRKAHQQASSWANRGINDPVATAAAAAALKKLSDAQDEIKKSAEGFKNLSGYDITKFQLSAESLSAQAAQARKDAAAAAGQGAAPPPPDTSLSDAAREKLKADHEKLLADLKKITDEHNNSKLTDLQKNSAEELAIIASINADKTQSAAQAGAQIGAMQDIFAAKHGAILDATNAAELAAWTKQNELNLQKAAAQKSFIDSKQIAWEQATLTQEDAQMAALERERAAAIAQTEELKLIGQERADALMLIDQTYEANKEALRKTASEKTAASQKAYTNAVMNSMVGVTGAFSGGMKLILGTSKKHAKELKALAMFEALVNGARSVMIALSGTPWPWLNAVNVGAAIATTATQIGTINAAKYERGGLPAGRDALIQVNERGQEAVLNAGATNRIGAGGVNALNNGSAISTRNVAEIHYSPTYSISGGDSGFLRKTLERDREWFSKFMFEEMGKRGYVTA